MASAPGPAITVTLTGPMGVFYLRPIERPQLWLAGGTGLAPVPVDAGAGGRAGLRSAHHALLCRDPRRRPGGTGARAETWPRRSAMSRSSRSWLPPRTTTTRKGFVTDHLTAEDLNDGDCDVYLCGPPPMVDAVRGAFRQARGRAGQFPLREVQPDRSRGRGGMTRRFEDKVMVVTGAAPGHRPPRRRTRRRRRGQGADRRPLARTQRGGQRRSAKRAARPRRSRREPRDLGRAAKRRCKRPSTSGAGSTS